jgi:hypothetical protein
MYRSRAEKVSLVPMADTQNIAGFEMIENMRYAPHGCSSTDHPIFGDLLVTVKHT